MNHASLATKKKIAMGSSMALVAFALVLGFQNCSPGVLQTTNQSSTFTEGGSGMEPVTEEKIAVGVNYSENTFISMLNLTGVAKPSNETMNSARNKKTKIPESGTADSVTAPMWMAITNLGGDVCLDLVRQEKALPVDQRRFFGKVDFAKGPSIVSADAKHDVIRRMARSFWGRNETLQEKTLIRASADQAFASAENTPAETEDSMLFICAAMLASLDAQKQ